MRPQKAGNGTVCKVHRQKSYSTWGNGGFYKTSIGVENIVFGGTRAYKCIGFKWAPYKQEKIAQFTAK